MNFRIMGQDDDRVAMADGEGILMASAQDMLDIIATAGYQHGCRRLILHRCNMDSAFFDLKNGLAGEVLQKVVNYGAALAIVGDFSEFTSRALRDFIYESNQGGRILFVPDEETAVQRLRACQSV